jgi:hypothetical protein
MKKVLIALFICIITSELNAQVIEYDYTQSTHDTLRPKLKNGNFARFKLTNINTFAQKVSINGALYSLNTPIPDGLKNAFKLSDEQVTSSLLSSNRAANTMNEAAKKAEEKAEEKAKSNPADTKTKDVKVETDSLANFCNKYYIAAEKVSYALAIERKLEETLSNEKNNNKAEMLSALLAKGINANSGKSLQKDKDTFEKAYEKVRNQYDKALKAARAANDEALETKIESAKETIIQAYEVLDKNYDTALNIIENLWQIANNEGNYMAISNPVFMKDADEIEFEIKIAKTQAELTSVKPITPNYNISGGTKFDYSIGPVFNAISDDVYFLDANKTLQQDKNTNIITPGIAAMMHITRRNTSNAAVGGMFGLNANFTQITDVDLGFLGGFTAMLGRDRKFFVSSGVSIFKVNRLKSEQFKTGTKYTDTDLPNVVAKVLKPSFFVSISMSIAKRVQIK